MACGMVEWSIGGNGRMAGMAGMAGMAERQKEWQNGSGCIHNIYGIFYSILSMSFLLKDLSVVVGVGVGVYHK